MAKRGQLTIFIIVGLLIVIIVGLFFMMKTRLGENVLGPPSEIKEIVLYTETCVSQLASEGVFQLSMQGGYINMPDYILSDKRSYVDNGFFVPLWLYKSDERMPTVHDMEMQLASYVDENLLGCLSFYLPFAKEYDIICDELPKSEVKISDREINIKTYYSLDINKKGSETFYSWDEFNSEVKSRLGEMYELSKEIMEYENREAFLEDYTDEMVACSDYLPYEGMEITCSPRSLLVSDMKDYTQQLVMHNLHFLQFEKTDFQETGMPYYDKQYKIDFTNKDYTEYKVNVIYNPAWGMDFEALPSHNGLVEPYEFEITNIIRSCVKVYHEKYNIDYPVIIQVMESGNPENAFYFASPVLVMQNLPNRYNEVRPWEVEADELDSEKYCSPTADITVYSLDELNRMVAEPSYRDNRKNQLRVYALDALYGYPDGVLFGVNISYQCVRFKCDIGTTGYEEMEDGLLMVDSLPRLKSGFPECTNGFLIANKPGYHQAVKQQTVGPDTDGEQVTIEMYALKDFDYGIRVVQDHNGVINDRALDSSKETVMILLKNEEQGFEKKIIYPSDLDYYTNLSLLMGDFTYNVEIMLTQDDELVGGANYNWTPSLNNLFYSNYVVFYVYKKDPLVLTTSPEESYELYKYALEASPAYLPRFQ
ncbi:hypothetical protein JXB31_04050 [Candidatus Woesearchaeota archaeon]|nr:hypothetical protein [Candidatus Woesearchaeota archaeon]